MSTKRYTDEFKIEAVRQIVDYGRPVAEVAERLGVSVHSLYGWRRQYGQGEVGRRVEQGQNAEVLRELGETCSRHRVARLMKNEGLRAMVGYGRRPRPLSGPGALPSAEGGGGSRAPCARNDGNIGETALTLRQGQGLIAVHRHARSWTGLSNSIRGMHALTDSTAGFGPVAGF